MYGEVGGMEMYQSELLAVQEIERVELLKKSPFQYVHVAGMEMYQPELLVVQEIVREELEKKSPFQDVYHLDLVGREGVRDVIVIGTWRGWVERETIMEIRLGLCREGDDFDVHQIFVLLMNRVDSKDLILGFLIQSFL